jgi:hypothetical protein
MLFFYLHGGDALWLYIIWVLVLIPALIFAFMLSLYWILSKRLKNREDALKKRGHDSEAEN